MHQENIVRLVKGGIDMIQNKKGLSDIVTTALIILLVAVAVAAIWAFVSPALRGTGTQFTKTSVCISNTIEPITCKSLDASPNNYPLKVEFRRTLTDGVARLDTFDVEVIPPTGGIIKDKVINTDPEFPQNQGELKSTDIDSSPVRGLLTNPLPQSRITATYVLPDNTIVKCVSLPIACNKP